MGKKGIVMYEVSQKQHYIFQTNRLRENIGGSRIIRDITEDPHKFFDGLLENKDFIRLFQSSSLKQIDLPKPEHTIVGGGNATYIFSSINEANQFAKNLSTAITKYFPGLDLFLINREFDWNHDSLFSKNEGDKNFLVNMRNELANKKNKRSKSVQQLSWGIHQMCTSSGLPANRLSQYDQAPIADELLVKDIIGIETRDKGYDKRFIADNEYLSDLENKQYEFLQEEHLMKAFKEDSDSKSYLAIISLDGNAMGVKVSDFFSKKFKDNKDYIEKYSEFSKHIDNAYTRAFNKMIYHVIDDYDLWFEEVYGNNNQLKEAYKSVIPLRPVIASGDDVSFITFGKLGIELARIFLQYLQEETIELTNGKQSRFNACAGVAIARHKFPFWQAFELADHLCDNAKKRLKQDEKHWQRHLNKTSEKDFTYDSSLIDWHLIEGTGMTDNVEGNREVFYQNEDESQLFMRPYYLQHESEAITHFASYRRTFLNTIKTLELSKNATDEQTDIPAMSKWKQLRDVYHRGVTQTEQWALLNQFNFSKTDPTSTETNPENKLFISYKDGFGTTKDNHDPDGINYAYFYDALEIFDYFVRLSEVKQFD